MFIFLLQVFQKKRAVPNRFSPRENNREHKVVTEEKHG